MNACNKLVVTRAELRGLDVPIVVDPVMEATTGSRLMGEGVLKILREELIPRATLVTPNKFEAEALTGLKIGGIDDVEKAAERLASLGTKAVLIKGGHILSGGKAIDFLLVEGEGRMLEWERLDVRTLHGTGCVLSSAVAAQLAKGEPLVRAVELGKEFQREHDVFTDLLRDEGIEVLMLSWLPGMEADPRWESPL